MDCETHPITSTNPSPTVVCLAAAYGTGKVVLRDRKRAGPLLLRLLDASGEYKITGMRIAYDVVATMRTFPETVSAWFRLMAQGRLSDVGIRERLDLLATVGDPDAGRDSHNLAELARRRLGYDDMEETKDDEDSVRLRFHELEGMDSRSYPKEFSRYVKKDARRALQVWQDQPNRKPEAIHVNGSVCNYLRTVQGLRVDKKAKAKLECLVHDSLGEEHLPLLYGDKKVPGLLTRSIPTRAGKTKEHVPACPRKACECPPRMLKPQKEKLAKSAVLIPMLQEICDEHGLVLKRLPPTEAMIKKGITKGNVCTDADYIAHLAAFSPILKQYETHLEFVKLRDSYFPAHEWPFGSGQTVSRVFNNSDDLKKTGRNSSRGVTKKNKDTALYPSVAIQLSDPRMRWCYRPTKGHVYAVADYSAIDLNCLAQTIHELYGSSTLLDQINAGINPHTFLACALAYDIEPRWKKRIKGKSETEAYKLFDGLKESKEVLDKVKVKGKTVVVTWGDFYKEVRDLAKKVGLGYAGGMGLETMIGLCRKELRSAHRPDGYVIDKAEAKRFREIWFRCYPEMRWYLRKWVPAQKDYTGEFLAYTSPMGMRRARCFYTECANGRALQTPAAEGMKIADFMVTRACYDPLGLDGKGPDILFGCRPVINMHDELVLEIPISTTRRMHRQAMRLGELMVKGMRKVLPDVTGCVAEPYLTTRWVKKAKAVRNKRGLLIPWTPSPGDAPWETKESA